MSFLNRCVMPWVVFIKDNSCHALNCRASQQMPVVWMTRRVLILFKKTAPRLEENLNQVKRARTRHVTAAAACLMVHAQMLLSLTAISQEALSLMSKCAQQIHVKMRGHAAYPTMSVMMIFQRQRAK